MYVCSVSNVVKARDPLTCLQIPDITAGSLLQAAETNLKVDRAEIEQRHSFPTFSMAAGDFVELYGGPDQEGCWDAVVTCFFIDTAPVVME